MIGLTLAETAQILNGALHGPDRAFVGVGTDTRKTLTGRLFFALRGPNFDAHEMVDRAAEAGAAGAVVEREVGSATLPWIRVADTRRALGRLANAWRRRHTASAAYCGP